MTSLNWFFICISVQMSSHASIFKVDHSLHFCKLLRLLSLPLQQQKWNIRTLYIQTCIYVRTEWDKLGMLQSWVRIRIRSLNFKCFQQIRNSMTVLTTFGCWMWIRRKILVACSTCMSDFICTDSQTVQTNLFFSQIQSITQTTIIECAV